MKETPVLFGNLALLGLAAFVAYVRLAVSPCNYANAASSSSHR
ncbi:MAG: hypothetical protein ACE5FI_13815 [Anaerolineales bacterium]